MSPPDAQALLGAMCRTFGLRGAGAVDEEETPEGDIPPLNLGDLDPEDARGGGRGAVRAVPALHRGSTRPTSTSLPRRWTSTSSPG